MDCQQNLKTYWPQKLRKCFKICDCLKAIIRHSKFYLYVKLVKQYVALLT